jgi:hypothetical protein
VKVIVVGCGPAGLAAAHAAVGLGAEVRILAPKRKTPQEGPLLIQRPIPGINTDHPNGTIHQRVIDGSILDYRYRLYGDVNIGISGDILKTEYHAWNHRETYNKLWVLYHDLIEEINRDGMLTSWDIICLGPGQACDVMVNTASANSFCVLPGHTFIGKQVAITPGHGYPDQPDNTIIFNGGSRYPWARSSKIFGVSVTEWALDKAPPGARRITKPISTDCNCHPKVLRTGRFGSWRNETWVDTAYWDTYTALEYQSRKEELDAIR